MRNHKTRFILGYRDPLRLNIMDIPLEIVFDLIESILKVITTTLQFRLDGITVRTVANPSGQGILTRNTMNGISKSYALNLALENYVETLLGHL